MSDENNTSTRSLRQRTSIPNTHPKARRRSYKIVVKEEPNVEDIYRQVNAKTEFNPSSLETIYESPKGKCQGLRDVMGVVKLKRHFRFTPFYNPSKIKIKMRKTKSKKLKRVGLNTSQDVTITLEQVEKALQQISEDENEENYQPKIIDNSTYCESNMKSNSIINEEKLLPEIMESISPMMVETKEEPLVERKTPETNMEEYPQFDSDWASLSPGKQKIDKSKRNKRRSGRVQPLCLSNIFNDTSLNHIDKKICSDITVETISKDDSAMQVDKNVSMNYELSQNTVTDTGKSFNGSRISTQTRPKRRNSGISKLIYRNSFVSASPDSPVIFEEDGNSDLDNHVNRRLLSPTLLLDQLSLCSPEPVKKLGTNRTRRKSARLSFGGEKPHYGTLWMDSKSPKNNNNNSNLNPQDTASDIVASTNFVTVPTNSLETTTNHSEQAKECIDDDIGHVNEVRDQIKSKLQVDLSEVKKFEFGDSPILSGIIDCKARLNEKGKFQVKKGSKINLKHFVSS